MRPPRCMPYALASPSSWWESDRRDLWRWRAHHSADRTRLSGSGGRALRRHVFQLWFHRPVSGWGNRREIMMYYNVTTMLHVWNNWLIMSNQLTFDWRGKNKLGWYFGSNANDSDSCVNMSCTLTSSPNTSIGCCCCCWLLGFMKSELIWDAWSTASGVPFGRPIGWCCVMSISELVSILLQLLLTTTTLGSLRSAM